MAYSDFDSLPSDEVDFVACESPLPPRKEEPPMAVMHSAVEIAAVPDSAQECQTKENVAEEEDVLKGVPVDVQNEGAPEECGQQVEAQVLDGKINQ